jgi:hypothetical protein
VPDDDDLLTAAGDRRTNIVQVRSRRESFVRLGLGAERPCQLAAGLASAQERAREHDLRVRILGSQPRAERTGLLTTFGGEGPQLIRLSGGRFGMTNEVEAHGAGG